MNQPTILVTGATGNIGRPLIDGRLAEGARVRALTRPATTYAQWAARHADAYR